MDVRNLKVRPSGSPAKPPYIFPELLSRNQVREEGRISSLQEEGSQGQFQTDLGHPVP